MTINKKQTTINIIFAIGDVIVSGVLLLILYKYVIIKTSPAELGIWSLILASTSVARLCELGLGGGVTKFVANYLSKKEVEKAADLIQTALVSLALISVVMLPVIFILIIYSMHFYIPQENIPLAKKLMPYAIISIFLNLLSSTINSAIDGCQRIDIRKILTMFGNLIYLIFSFFFISKFGIIGLAYSQIIQGFFLLLSGWISLHKVLNKLPFLPYKFCLNLFKEIFNYGFNFQIISLLAILIDPITKAMLGKYGGPDVVGYFEMANRLINNLKSLIVNANQVLVPLYASQTNNNELLVKNIFLKNIKVLTFITIPFFLFWASISPAISFLWIGNFSKPFVWSVVFISISCFFATNTGSAYFAYMGTGKFKKVTNGHLRMTFLNLLLGPILGHLIQYQGVLLANSLSFFYGVFYITGSFIKDINSQHLRLISPKDIIFGGLYLLIGSIGLFASILTRHYCFFAIFIIVLYIVIFVASFFRHPTGIEILRLLKKNRLSDYR